VSNSLKFFYQSTLRHGSPSSHATEELMSHIHLLLLVSYVILLKTRESSFQNQDGDDDDNGDDDNDDDCVSEGKLKQKYYEG
jgi:hypothetical protein